MKTNGDRGRGVRRAGWIGRLLPAVLLLVLAGGVAPAVADSSPSLVIALSGVPTQIDATHAGSFTVSLSNTGPAESHPSVTLSATLGAVSLTGPSGWTCSGATCNYSGAIAKGASAVFTGSLTAPDPVDCAAAQSPASSMQCPIVVTATATSEDRDADDTSTTTAQTVGVYPDIAVAATAPAYVAAGQTMTLTVTLTNTGSGDANGVSLTDALPPLAAAGSYATFVAQSSSAGCAADSASTVVCAAGTLAPGGSVTFTVAVQVPPLAVDAAGQQLVGSVTAADTEEGAQPVSPVDDSASTTTTVLDGFAADAGGGSKISTPGLGTGHAQTTIVTLSGAVTAGPVFVDDSLTTATCAGGELYGNPVTITSPVAPNSAPNTVQLIYGSGPGGIPVGEALGNIQVTRQATLGADQQCFVLAQCGTKAGKAKLPTGDLACVVGVKRNRPTGIVTITLLDTGGDPSYRGSG